jgi:methanogenic corrinoid protein MtbC1
MGTTFRSLNTGDYLTGSYQTQGEPALRESKFDPKMLVRKPLAPLWTEILKTAIESEIIPRLLIVQRDAAAVQNTVNLARPPNAVDIAAFVDLIIADDMEQVRAVADRVIVLSGGRDTLLDELLTPAARLLGEMWERDICDFTTVTLGVYRLDQIMKETCAVGRDDYSPLAHDRTILLAPAPGEQHSFGLNMVADVFREGGWCVRSASAVSRTRLTRLVGEEWFDLVGFSVSADRALKGLPSCIRAVRQSSSNPDLGVFVGGRAITCHPERTRFLGADGTANDPRQALREANIFVEATVTERLHQSKIELVDIG